MAQPTFRVDQGAERIENPPVAVQFLLALLLKAKYDLDRKQNVDEGLSSVSANMKGILEYMSGNSLAVVGVFGNTFLVTTHLCGTSDADMEAKGPLDLPRRGVGVSVD